MTSNTMKCVLATFRAPITLIMLLNFLFGFILIEVAVSPLCLLIWLVLCILYTPVSACCGEEELKENGVRIAWIMKAMCTTPISDGEHGWGDGVAAFQVFLLWGQGEKIDFMDWAGGVLVGNPYDVFILIPLLFAIACGSVKEIEGEKSNLRAVLANHQSRRAQSLMANQANVNGNNNQVDQKTP